MKTLIAINWALSLCVLCVDTELTPLLGVLACAAWFVASTYLLLFIDKRRKKFDFEAFNKNLETKLRMDWLKNIFRKKGLQQPNLKDARELDAAIWYVGQLAATYGYKAIITFERLKPKYHE
jgi:hypothetical protein